MSSSFCAHCSPNFTFIDRFRQLDIQSRLRTNQYPLSAEKKDISHLIKGGRSDLHRYTAELDRLQSQIVRLENERRELRRYVEMSQALLAPIRKLPEEILEEVFMFCGQDTVVIEEDPHGIPSYETELPGVVIGEVSSHWREVSLRSRRLWSSFRLELRATPDMTKFYAKKSNWVKIFLSRSKQSPLEIRLYVDSEEILIGHPVLQALLAESYRFHFLELEVPHLDSEPFTSLRNKLPILQELHLTRWGDRSLHEQFTDIFENAPTLSRVTLESLLIPPVPILPWKQITTLNCLNADLLDILAGLSNYTHLRELELAPSILKSDIELAGANPINLPSTLHSLTLHVLGDGSKTSIERKILALLFRNLSGAKSLTSLSVSTHEVTWPTAEFCSFIARSSCSLTSFSIVNADISGTDMISTLRLLPSLTRLTIHEPRPFVDAESPASTVFTTELFAAMRIQSRSSVRGPSPLVPRLTHLDIVAGNKDIDVSLLLEVVKSRTGVVGKAFASLEKFSLDILELASIEVFREFRRLGRAGLQLVLIDFELEDDDAESEVDG